MPNHFDGPGMMGPDPMGAHFALAGLSTLVWIFLIGLFVWGALKWLLAQPAGARRPAKLERPALTPVERLRLAYVVGDIDALTYELALDHLLASANSIDAALGLLQPRMASRPDSRSAPTVGEVSTLFCESTNRLD